MLDENLQNGLGLGAQALSLPSASDYGRRSAARKATAFASLRAQGSRSCRFAGNCAPGPCTSRPYAGLNLNCQKANRTGGRLDA
jgi:hypothetical protein